MTRLSRNRFPILATLFGAAVFATVARGAVVRQYDASLNTLPNVQGWTSFLGQAAGTIVNDGGTPALRMNANNCCALWHNPLTAQEVLDSFTDGWTLSAVIRANSTLGFGYFAYNTPGTGVGSDRRWDVAFGFDGTNTWVGLSSFFDAANPALQVSLPGNGYFSVEMRYDPVSNTASLWVNGVQQLTGYTGHTQFMQGLGPMFGASSSVAVTNSEMYFANVALVRVSPVPEVQTSALCAGALLTLGLWRRRSVG